MEVICSNQWNILEITVHNEKKYSIDFSFLASEIYVPHIITI
jgi:hypothetical protein